jgi:hypothetical protein
MDLIFVSTLSLNSKCYCKSNNKFGLNLQTSDDIKVDVQIQNVLTMSNRITGSQVKLIFDVDNVCNIYNVLLCD